MRVEVASALHVDAVADLWKRTNLTTPYNDPHADFEFARKNPNAEVLVGIIDDEIVSSVLAGHDGHRGWLYYVAVDPAFQGKGLGAEIVLAGEDWLRRQGIWKVQLMVRSTNIAVKEFYEHLGYEQSNVVVLSKKVAESFSR